MSKQEELVHIGYTNGLQIFYGATDEGSFYPNTEGDCYIPVYMLKTHLHRIESTSRGIVTAKDVERAKNND